MGDRGEEDLRLLGGRRAPFETRPRCRCHPGVVQIEHVEASVDAVAPLPYVGQAVGVGSRDVGGAGLEARQPGGAARNAALGSQLPGLQTGHELQGLELVAHGGAQCRAGLAASPDQPHVGVVVLADQVAHKAG